MIPSPKSPKTTVLAFVLLCFWAFAGCDDPSVAPAVPPSVNIQSVGAVSYGQPAAVSNADDQRDVSAKARMQMAQRLTKSVVAFTKAAALADNWQEANHAVQSLLEQSSPLDEYLREQIAANTMFREWLLKGESSPEKMKATAFYTGLLIKNRSPQAITVLHALKQLQGYWSEQRIAEAAAVAIDAAQAEIDGELSESRHEEMTELPEVIETSQNRHAHELMGAVNKLEGLASSP